MARARAAASRPADRSDLFNDRRHGARLPHPHELLVPDPAGPVTRTSAGKRSQVGFSKLYPKWDVNPAKNPQAFQQGIRNLAAVHHLTKEHYPEEFEEGPRWHEEVHKGVTRTIRGTKMTHEQGSGILAVIGPPAGGSVLNTRIMRLTRSGETPSVPSALAPREVPSVMTPSRRCSVPTSR